jgi:hypothetical protein
MALPRIAVVALFNAGATALKLALKRRFHPKFIWPRKMTINPYQLFNKIPASVPPSGLGKLRVVIFGSSTDEHCHVSMNGTIKVASVGTRKIATWTKNGANHYLQSGVRGFLGASLSANTPASPANYRAFGPITVIGPNKLTMDVTESYSYARNATGAVAWEEITAENVAMGFHSLNSWCGPSWYKWLYQSVGGRVDLVTTYALGGETTSTKTLYYKEIINFSNTAGGAPQLVIGSFGIGNDVSADGALNSIAEINQTIDNLT